MDKEKAREQIEQLLDYHSLELGMVGLLCTMVGIGGSWRWRCSGGYESNSDLLRWQK